MSIFDDCPELSYKIDSNPKLIPMFEKNIKRVLKEEVLCKNVDWNKLTVDAEIRTWNLFAIDTDVEPAEIKKFYLCLKEKLSKDKNVDVNHQCIPHSKSSNQEKKYFSYVQINNKKYSQKVRIFWISSYRNSTEFDFCNSDTNIKIYSHYSIKNNYDKFKMLEYDNNNR